MSKLTDIKYRIDQLDGGAFQNLCDEYLNSMLKEAGCSLGMHTGTDKSAKGNPDTFYRTPEGKIIFAMYTTQKSNFINKALEDLEKCFDEQKTGLSSDPVAEIVYCHTYGRLTPGETQQLHKYCEDRRTALTLIGLDKLGRELYLRYPRIVKDFLGINVGTGQIAFRNEYVKMHDANKMSAPLDTEFMFREEEIKTAKEKLSKSDVLVLSGPAGVGKTRLALQICDEIEGESASEIICIKSNDLAIYDDFVSTVEADKNYLIIIDDANELTELKQILSFLPETEFRPQNIKKIIMTVRDYAKKQLIEKIYDFEIPEILNVGMLKDDEISNLVKNIYEINNPIFLDRISKIAEGNARIAMLAGKVASENNSFNSIQDATELYEHYYNDQIIKIKNGETTVISAGIMAFFQLLHLENLNSLQPVFEAVNLTADQFISDLKYFHDLELVEIRHNKAAKISDQCFSNYLLKYVFVDKKLISLNQMIENYFWTNKEKVIAAINIILNLFNQDNNTFRMPVD